MPTRSTIGRSHHITRLTTGVALTWIAAAGGKPTGGRADESSPIWPVDLPAPEQAADHVRPALALGPQRARRCGCGGRGGSSASSWQAGQAGAAGGIDGLPSRPQPARPVAQQPVCTGGVGRGIRSVPGTPEGTPWPGPNRGAPAPDPSQGAGGAVGTVHPGPAARAAPALAPQGDLRPLVGIEPLFLSAHRVTTPPPRPDASWLPVPQARERRGGRASGWLYTVRRSTGRRRNRPHAPRPQEQDPRSILPTSGEAIAGARCR